MSMPADGPWYFSTPPPEQREPYGWDHTFACGAVLRWYADPGRALCLKHAPATCALVSTAEVADRAYVRCPRGHRVLTLTSAAVVLCDECWLDTHHPKEAPHV